MSKRSATFSDFSSIIEKTLSTSHPSASASKNSNVAMSMSDSERNSEEMDVSEESSAESGDSEFEQGQTPKSCV